LPVQAAPPRGPTWTDVDAVIELPAGHLADFGAIHRGMLHGLPLVNGYSGYFPHHYLPLLYALDHCHLVVLREFPTSRGVAVSIDRWNGNSLAMSAALRDMDGAVHLGASDRLDTFVLRNTHVAPPLPGRTLPVSQIWANRADREAERMVDGRIDTGWRS